MIRETTLHELARNQSPLMNLKKRSAPMEKIKQPINPVNEAA